MYHDIKYLVKNNMPLGKYLTDISIKRTNLRNAANFRIRQYMTGLKKEEPTPLEQEAITEMRQAVDPINEIRWKSFHKKVMRLDEKLKNGNISQDDYKKSFPNQPNLVSPLCAERWFPRYEFLEGIFKVSGNPDYNALPAQVNQEAIRDCIREWKSFFKASESYARDPSRFFGKPKPPGYLAKKKPSTVRFTNIVCKILPFNNNTLKERANLSIVPKHVKNVSYLRFPNTECKLVIKSLPEGARLKEVKACPVEDGFVVHVIFDDGNEIPQLSPESSRIACGDFGVDNFLAIGNNCGINPIVVSGKETKSKNRWFNKIIAQLRSIAATQNGRLSTRRIRRLFEKRLRWFDDIFHKLAKRIVLWMKDHKIEEFVLGNNKDWKQGSNLGKINNQNFVQIPFMRFAAILEYLCEREGIRFVKREESYTSKADLIAGDYIPTYGVDDNNAHFSGKRIHRGLYQTSTGLQLNADVHGSCNIGRKEHPNMFDGIKNYDYLTNLDFWEMSA